MNINPRFYSSWQEWAAAFMQSNSAEVEIVPVQVPTVLEADLPPAYQDGMLLQVTDGANAGKLHISYSGNWNVV